MHLYERCREARRRTGLSQERLAIELNVSRGAVAQWEMAKGTSPSVDNMIALARRSGVAFEWLATERGPMVAGEPMVSDEHGSYGSLTPRQQLLLHGFNRLPKPKQDALLELVKTEA